MKMPSFPHHPDDKPAKALKHSFILSLSFNFAFVVVVTVTQHKLPVEVSQKDTIIVSQQVLCLPGWVWFLF